MQQSKLTLLLLLTNGWHLFLGSSLISCSYHFVWILMLQFPTAANTEGSSFCHFSKFKWFKEVSDLPQRRYKEEVRATRSQAEGVHPFLAAGSYYISSALCWARTINTGSETASSTVAALPSYSFNVSIHNYHDSSLQNTILDLCYENLSFNSD